MADINDIVSKQAVQGILDANKALQETAKSLDSVIAENEKLKKHLALFDEATGEKYHAAVSAAVDKLDFDILYFQRNYRALRQPRFKAVYAAMSPKARLKFRLDQFFPGLMNLYDKMKKKHGQL